MERVDEIKALLKGALLVNSGAEEQMASGWEAGLGWVYSAATSGRQWGGWCR